MLLGMIPGLQLVDLIYLYSTNSPTGVTAADLRRIRRDSGDVRSEEAPQAPHRKWTRLSEEARVDVATRYEAVSKTTELAREYGVAKSTIIGILRSKAVVMRRQSLTEKQVSEGVRRYESGLSLSRVAEVMKMNQETMRVAIIAAGVVLRPPTGR